MSRIHEALKKAEQERASSPVAEIDSPAPPQPAVSVAPDRAPIATPGALRGPDSITSMSDYLRFEDLRARCAQPTWHLDPDRNVFFNSEVSATAAEQLPTLRSRLYQLRNDLTLRSLLITSSVPGEGKTFVTSNLAQAIVRQPDRRVLIIDADLRCARLHSLLGAPARPGLTDYLSGEADEVSVIQRGPDSNLCFIPGGTEVANPSELLSNGRLKQLLDRMTPIFDWVIFDSPPCLPVADATILAGLCDGVLLVVRAATTPAAVAQRACQELKDSKLIGVVLNAVNQEHAYGSYYPQGYGYVYGQKEVAESRN